MTTPTCDSARHLRARRVALRLVIAWVAPAVIGSAACSVATTQTRLPAAPPDAYAWRLPPGFPPPPVPGDNPMSAAKVELGRRLFYDRRLSGNGTLSCASCHEQRRAFTDGRAQAIGSTGESHQRSAMSLTNVAYNASFGWADSTLLTLEAQIFVPMFNETPVEMGARRRVDEILGRLRQDAAYPSGFAAAFPGADESLTFANLVRAVAAFERTLISGDSPYDRLLFRDERSALSESARRGMRLFFSDRLGCSVCHAGVNISGPVHHRTLPRPALVFSNTGLYDVDGRGSYPASDRGLIDVTARGDDTGRFRAPTLRNIAVTAPYMHDGSVPTLDAVLDHYAAGGRAAQRAGVGTDHFKSRLIAGFTLSHAERQDVIAFLGALTDSEFLEDPRFADPF